MFVELCAFMRSKERGMNRSFYLCTLRVNVLATNVIMAVSKENYGNTYIPIATSKVFDSSHGVSYGFCGMFLKSTGSLY